MGKETKPARPRGLPRPLWLQEPTCSANPVAWSIDLPRHTMHRNWLFIQYYSTVPRFEELTDHANGKDAKRSIYRLDPKSSRLSSTLVPSSRSVGSPTPIYRSTFTAKPNIRRFWPHCNWFFVVDFLGMEAVVAATLLCTTDEYVRPLARRFLTGCSPRYPNRAQPRAQAVDMPWRTPDPRLITPGVSG